MKLCPVLLRVEGKSPHWQQIAAGFNWWHVINSTARQHKQERQRLRLRAQAAGGGCSETQDPADTLKIRGVAVRDRPELAQCSETSKLHHVLAAIA
jgi:hypothetical protein